VETIGAAFSQAGWSSAHQPTVWKHWWDINKGKSPLASSFFIYQMTPDGKNIKLPLWWLSNATMLKTCMLDCNSKNEMKVLIIKSNWQNSNCDSMWSI